jgi:hypothetical protein
MARSELQQAELQQLVRDTIADARAERDRAEEAEREVTRKVFRRAYAELEHELQKCLQEYDDDGFDRRSHEDVRIGAAHAPRAQGAGAAAARR